MPVTRIIVIANIGAFIVHALVLATQGKDLNAVLGLSWAGVRNGALWQPLTSMFMHGGYLHLGVNMLALWSIGTPIERDIGSRRFTWLYFLSGMGGSLAVLLLPGSAYTVTVGASGAVLGILGALAMLFPNAMLIVLFFPMKARTAALIFGVVSLSLALFGPGAGGISHAGHLGGLLAGVLYVKFAIKRRASRSFDSYYSNDSSSPYDAQPRSGHSPEMLRELMRRFMRDPRSAVRKSGHFIRPDVPPDQNSSAPDDDSGDFSKPKRLYYDPKTGEFFFK